MADDECPEDLEKLYDQMFAYRYTDEDPDYQQTISKPIPPCPCITGYFTRSKRNFDNRDNRNQGGRGQWGQRGRGRWQGHGNRYRDDRGRNEGHSYYDRDDRGQGSYRHYDQDRHGNRHSEGRRYNPY
ncbi:RNA guanine-N7 methyltransferase activating subunit-like [Mercenaria mercenaria]|uniref:RNA guanine-N7 methyltransferase activating subunit-like n=1 Tax=Mercenaria mercenaria TaxID=6596 RepID=UPI00234E4133|nr:RNA guanine-N7 methyltransferase activating subunit-like [Mercenaria mercenaria]XP_045171272.2 RNA guanine-N7 methyltransferase activating subunit-like [Mercenaria mercenaria]XP_045171273.2 RNA guanine-N7 methyltransferase activating subunit-like [Mercenaria mercenaria]XP_045171274.2 RNA guanine-N7 methyltransferase activating subunit-like [Mercenaria mercenaria]